MSAPLVKDPGDIRLAMIGMVEGNGHPYSWSAIINGGFDSDAMSRCPYPAIPQYLSAEPRENLGIAGARVTHIWCESRAEAQHVAHASLIDHVLRDPLDAIGAVDAVVIPTDKPKEHLDRARPFSEAGLPLFIDKPLTSREDHLRQFIAWHDQGRPFMSSSALRYAREFAELSSRRHEVGELRLIVHTMAKSWERYGIHALEGVYPLLEPGRWLSVRHGGDDRHNIVHVRHASGVEVVLPVISDLYGAFGNMTLYGTGGCLSASFRDTFSAFKAQLQAFVDYLRTGVSPIPFAETVELMKIIIAGLRSREEAGRDVRLCEIRIE